MSLNSTQAGQASVPQYIFSSELNLKNAAIVLSLSALLGAFIVPSVVAVGTLSAINLVVSLGVALGAFFAASSLEKSYKDSTASSTKSTVATRKKSDKNSDLGNQKPAKPILNAHKNHQKNQAQEKFTFVANSLSDKKIAYHLINSAKQDVSFERMLTLLQSNPKVRESLMSTLRTSPFEAYFMECPGINRNTISTKRFEFVLIDAPQLANRKPNHKDFDDYLKNDKKHHVAHFDNIGKDAHLVSPCPIAGKDKNYLSLASFSRTAPLEQQHHLWMTVAEQAENIIRNKGNAGTWLSTSGLGVPWLHVRLDSIPKYYHHQDYKISDDKVGKSMRR